MEKHKVHPLKSFVVVMTQFPIWVTVSLTLRTMAGHYGSEPFDGFLTEGVPWCVSLLSPDASFILPLSLGK